MPAPHPAGRLGRAAASGGLVLVLGGVVLAGPASGPLAVVAVVAAVVAHLVGLVLARTAVITVAVVGLVVGAVSAYGTDMGADTAAPFAAGLLVAAELGWWAAERRTPMAAERGVDLPRWLALAGCGAGALVVGFGIFLVSSVRVPGGALTEIAAVAATIAVLVVARVLLRRAAPER